MSLIYITKHNEIIYDSVKSRQIVRKKSPRYEKYIDLEYKDPNSIHVSKQACGTMGPAEYPVPDPSNFLRKKPKSKRPQTQKFERHCMKHEKFCALPDAKGEFKHKDINFIKDNVKVMKNLKPPVQAPKIVDTRNGTTRKVDCSMDPHYIHLKNYGKRPHYLLQRLMKHKELLQTFRDKEKQKDLPNCQYITRQERQDILNGLKQNWEELQLEFQLLPMITDTIPKKIRKCKLEDELKELEKDILLIEKHPYIYVLDES